MAETNEEESFALLRTLLALERTYLAEERTTFAEFRTWLAIALLAPSISTLFAYVYSSLQIDSLLPFSIINITFLLIVFILGVKKSIDSRLKTNIIREKRKRLIEYRSMIMKGSIDLDFDFIENFTN